MGLREQINTLNDSIQGDQRDDLRSKLGAESWEAYQAALDPELEDEDDVALALVRFVVSLDDAQAFKDALDDEQKAIVEKIEAHLTEEMGL